MMFLGSVVLLVQLLEPFVASDFTEVVQTSSGPVQGVTLRTVHSTHYAAFKGIKYAEPPIKALRFKPPVPVKPWTETWDATVEGERCPQYDSDGSIIGSEDCLFLNVFTPVTRFSETPKELKSVMVWIHEGTFADGSGSTYIKQPDYLLERDVVFVSMNYRLGALGFLSLDHRDASGNQGLKDQNLALKWVQANIEKFGGDPERVTIFGKGAGAASVGFHVLSEASKGLFHRAISMSGTPLAPGSFVSRSKAAKRGRQFANLVKKQPSKLLSSFSCITKESCLNILSEAPLERLLRKTRRIDEIAPFVPTLEKPRRASNVFLFEDLTTKYKSGNFNQVPQILGSTQLDTIRYTNRIKRNFVGINESIEMINTFTLKKSEFLPYIQKGEKILGLRIKAMGNRTTEVYPDPDDILIIDPISETRRFLGEKNGNNPVYQYRMGLPSNSHSELNPSDENINLHATAYAHDLNYIFYISFTNHYSSSSRSNDSVSALWTNFAKYGNPTPDGISLGPVQLAWPASGTSETFLRIDNKLKIEQRSPITLVRTGPRVDGTPLRFFFES